VPRGCPIERRRAAVGPLTHSLYRTPAESGIVDAVSDTDTTPGSAGPLVRTGLAGAFRRQRICESSRQFWRAAPIIAAFGLAIAAISLWAGWTAILALGVLGLGFAGLTAYTFVRRRDRTVTDPVAAGIDRDAGLDGELRSAAWFAAAGTRDIWTDFHLDRAAARLRAVNWVERYPAARAPRAKLATSVMVIAALALSMTMTDRGRLSSSTLAPKASANGATQGLVPGEPLPPELQKLLADLLAAAESGNLSAQERLAASAELRELLARIGQLRDFEALKELARAMNANPILSDRTLQEMQALAERTRRASEAAAMPPEIRNALEKLAENLSIAAAKEQGAGDDPVGAANAESGEPGSKAKADADSASIQSVKDADAGSGAGVLMMSDENAGAGGAPGLGSGGGSAAENGAGTMPDLALALRRETVEASADNAGENVLTDTRRKTEHGLATATYTQGAAGAFDRSGAAAPPPVPEGRRSAVQTYFVRKP
jgi:hypothetical protein